MPNLQFYFMTLWGYTGTTFPRVLFPVQFLVRGEQSSSACEIGEAGKQQPVCSSGLMVTDREAQMHWQQFVHALLSTPGFSPTDQRALKTT